MTYPDIVEDKPVFQAPVLARSRDILNLFDQKPVDHTTEITSKAFTCEAFSKFGLYLYIKSTSTPTTLQVKVQFLNPRTAQWHTFKQGAFASMFWEDTATASGVYEIYNGDCAGRSFRITLTGVGTSSSAYFTVGADVEFYN